MNEYESQPRPENQKEYSDAELLSLIDEALQLFNSEDPKEQQRLDEELLPLLSAPLKVDLLLSSNTKGILQDKRNELELIVNTPFKEALAARQAELVAGDELVEFRAHDDDSLQTLNTKLKVLHELEDEVRKTIDMTGDPEATREELLEATKRYAKRLDLELEPGASLGILIDIATIIDDYQKDIVELIAKKQSEQAG